jgi:hypothetical protein
MTAIYTRNVFKSARQQELVDCTANANTFRDRRAEAEASSGVGLRRSGQRHSVVELARVTVSEPQHYHPSEGDRCQNARHALGHFLLHLSAFLVLNSR